VPKVSSQKAKADLAGPELAKRRLALKIIVSSELIAGILDGIVWEGVQSLAGDELKGLKTSVAVVMDDVYRQLLRPAVNEFPDMKPIRLK
jgi:hypothetical protein